LSGPQLAECGDGMLLVEIDHIHDEVVLVNDPDRQGSFKWATAKSVTLNMIIAARVLQGR
jgi:hypothetical protein